MIGASVVIAVASSAALSPIPLQSVLSIETRQANDLVVTNDRVVYHRDGTLYAFDSTKRQVLWKKSAPSRFAVSTTTVFALQASGTLEGFDLSSGKAL